MGLVFSSDVLTNTENVAFDNTYFVTYRSIQVKKTSGLLDVIYAILCTVYNGFCYPVEFNPRLLSGYVRIPDVTYAVSDTSFYSSSFAGCFFFLLVYTGGCSLKSF